MRISDWSSDVCASDLCGSARVEDERAVDEDLLGDGVDAERILAPQHDVGQLARLERAGLVGNAHDLRGVEGDPLDRLLLRNVDPREAPGGDPARALAVEALDQSLIVQEFGSDSGRIRVV